MKRIILICITALLFGGCKKDKVSPPLSYYQSQGNFLLLIVGDSLESIYEFSLPTIQTFNDSLALNYDLIDDGMSFYSYWKLTPNEDTLFWSYANIFTFNEERISSNDLKMSSSHLAFEPNQFQLIDAPPNTNTEELWSEISNVDLVREYRSSAPNSKIVISRQIQSIYNEEYNFSALHEKHFLFLVK